MIQFQFRKPVIQKATHSPGSRNGGMRSQVCSLLMPKRCRAGVEPGTLQHGTATRIPPHTRHLFVGHDLAHNPTVACLWMFMLYWCVRSWPSTLATRVWCNGREQKKQNDINSTFMIQRPSCQQQFPWLLEVLTLSSRVVVNKWRDTKCISFRKNRNYWCGSQSPQNTS